MQCPACKEITLVMAERQGVEIDYCPQCRGVWLDRGELDKIIERSTSEPVAQQQNREIQKNRPQNQDKEDYQYKKKKRKSFIGDLFDF